MSTPEPKPSNEAEVLSDRELAGNWLTRELDLTRKALDMNSISSRFTESYHMKVPHRSPNLEPGGLDMSDYEKDVAEFNQWPDEQESEMGRLEDEEQSLSAKLSDLQDDQVKLGENDPYTIDKLAGMERTRLAEIAELQKRKLREQNGEHFEGTEEVHDLIGKLKGAQRSGAFKEGNAVGGWTYGFTSEQGYAYHHNEGKGPLDGYDISIAIGKDFLEKNPTFTNVRFTDLRGIHAEKLDYGTNVDRNGTWMRFNINKHLVKGHFAGEVKPVLEFGGHGSFKLAHEGNNTTISQEQFDGFRTTLQSLVDVAKAKPAAPPKA